MVFMHFIPCYTFPLSKKDKDLGLVTVCERSRSSNLVGSLINYYGYCEFRGIRAHEDMWYVN